MIDPAPDRQDALAPLRRTRRGILLASGAIAVVFLAFLSGFAAFLDSLDRAERDPAATTDGIVALTGGAHRIGDAIDLLAKGFAGRLL
ncbi:MAG TPA: YdcF family protein, partial [Enterovirga sp.]|nr:YdcF family protein [Enterovirga sp.]